MHNVYYSSRLSFYYYYSCTLSVVLSVMGEKNKSSIS